MKAGETTSVNAIRRAYDRYGPSIFTTILQCITQCGEGNPGMVIGSVAHGVGRSLVTKPNLLEPPSLAFDIFDEIYLSEMLQEAKNENAVIKTRSKTSCLARSIKSSNGMARGKQRDP